MSGIMLILREASYTPSNGGGTQGGNSQGGGTNNDQEQEQNPTNPGGTQQPGTTGPAGNERMAELNQYVTGNQKLAENGSIDSAPGQIVAKWIPVSELFSSGWIKLTPKAGTSYLGIAYDSGKSKISVLTGAWAWVSETAQFQIPSGTVYISIGMKNSSINGGDDTPVSSYFDSITD